MQTPTAVEFTVPGVPAPGGSKKAFVVHSKKPGAKPRAVVVDDAKRNKEWRACVAHEAAEAMRGRALFDGPVILSITFYMPRPKKHYRGGVIAKGLLPTAPRFHSIAPDAGKLARSTQDALSSVVYVDDSLIVEEHHRKLYSDADNPPGARIRVAPIAETTVGKVPVNTEDEAPLFKATGS